MRILLVVIIMALAYWAWGQILGAPDRMLVNGAVGILMVLGLVLMQRLGYLGHGRDEQQANHHPA